VEDMWQAIYEEGEEHGNHDAANGVDFRYTHLKANWDKCKDDPYYQGYVTGYEDRMKEN